jgi:hypothetical protein
METEITSAHELMMVPRKELAAPATVPAESDSDPPVVGGAVGPRRPTNYLNAPAGP